MIAIRGAIQVDEDTREAITSAAAALCVAITRENQLDPANIISAIFTLTPDLHADFPARAAREQGWGDVPMICAQEIGVPGALPRVCRVLLHVDAPGPPRHVYLGGAAALRPDLAGARR
jgi:chorismate mutase